MFVKFMTKTCIITAIFRAKLKIVHYSSSPVYILKTLPPIIRCSLMTAVDFRSAVDVVLQNWTALQLAVSQGAAGPQSAAIAKWMVEATVQWFSENKDLETYEVEDFLVDIVNQEFNLIIDDGSVVETSRLICEFFALSNSNKEELTKRVKALPKCDLTSCKVEPDESEEKENSEDIMETEEPNEPQEDPDGWTTVSRKKK